MGIISASYTIAEVADGVPTGENLLFSTPKAGGNTTVVDKVVKWNGTITDTYFYVEVSTAPTVGNTYTFSCECVDPDGVLSSDGWTFGLFAQTSTAHIVMKAGKCSTTFLMTSEFLQILQTNLGKILIDDTGARPSSGSTNLAFSKFKLEEGTEATAYCLCVPETIGPQGDDAISYWLKKSATIISKDTNNSNVLTPSSVTVTAKKNVGGTTSDFTTGTIKLYADGTEISPTSSTSSSITFNPSASVSTYVIKLFSGSIELDAESIPIIATGKNGTNGVNAVTTVLTNDSAQVPTDSSGNNPDFTTATTTIEVYEGGNKVTPTSYGPHVCSNCTVNATNAASVTVTGMSANSATVTLKAAYGGKTYSKAFTISKQKQGIQGNPGVNATSYWLEKSATIISKDVNNLNRLTPSSVTLTAYKNVGGTTSRFTAGVIKLYADGTEITPSATETRTFTPSASVSQYVAKLYDGSVEVDVESIPIVATGLNGQTGSPGTDAMFAALTNDSAQVPADENGNVPSGTTYPSTTIELYKGATKQTSGVTYPAATYTGCTISQNNGTVTLTSMTSDYATVTLKATYGGVTYSKQFTATKQKQGIHGNDGDSPTAYPQYALVYAGTTPGTNDWQDERPQNWALGYSYWTRTKYVYSPTRTEYSEAIEDTTYNQYMSSQTYLRIITDKTSYNKDLRSSDTFVINFNASYYGYQNPSISWNINGDVTSGPTVIYSKAQSAVPDLIQVSCSISSVVNNMAYTTTTSININVIDVTTYNLNFGISDTVLTGTYVEGDSYALKDGDDYIPYVYHNGQWVQVNESTISLYPSQMAQIRDSILSQGINIPKTSVAIYAYFKYASIQNAQIDTINTSQITLSDGGMIQSEVYNDTSGFRITSAGDATFVGSHVINSTVSGSFTSKPLETQDEMEGTQITGTWGSQAYYNDGDVYSVIAANVTDNQINTSNPGTYGGTSFTKILRLTTESQKGEAKILAQNGSVTSASSISGTLPVNCNSVTFSGQPFYKLLQLWGNDRRQRNSTVQYKNGSGSWTNLIGSVTAQSSYNDTLQIRHTYDSSDIIIGTYDNWQNGTLLPVRFGINGKCPRVVKAPNGNLITMDFNRNVYYSTDNGLTWTSVTLDGTANVSVIMIRGRDCVLICAGNQGIWRTTDGGARWTKVWTRPSDDNRFLPADAATNGTGEIRVVVSASGYYYKSTDDGVTWTQVTDSDYGDSIVYVNGSFLSSANRPFTRSDGSSLSYVNGKYVWIQEYNSTGQTSREGVRGPVYTSTDGTNWTLTGYMLPDPGEGSRNWVRSASKIYYTNGYYYVAISGQGNGNTGIFRSSDLASWTTVRSWAGGTGCNLSYINGRLIAGTQNDGDYYLDFGRFSDSDLTITQVGNSYIRYNYGNYQIGANLLTTDTSIVATITNNNNFWHTSATVISSLSLNPTPYYKFSSFNASSFDARKYTSDSTFTVRFTTYTGNNLNLTRSSSDGHYYNLKWNGSVFSVFLNGSEVGSFSSEDYFRANGSIVFTPMGQLDAILVKDVIPKVDSQYTLGASGNEFLAGYINTVYGNLEGNATSSTRSLRDRNGVSLTVPNYGATSTEPYGKYFKIYINAEVGWMTRFTVRLYQNYVGYDIAFQGYNYGSNHWHAPTAELIAGTGSITVYFGYDGNYKLWVAIPGHYYTALKILDVVNGYVQVEDFADKFQISLVSSLTENGGTIQSTQTIYRTACWA